VISDHEALLIAALLVLALGVLAIAPTLRVPYPILLVLGGLALGLIPGIPHPQLDPDLVLVGILPPLLYAAAFFTPLRELRRNARAIGALAIGLVLATVVVVAAVGHYAVGLAWSVAFVLGAVVAPTDPVAVTALAERIGMPRRIVSLIEGESLVNDATALVAYRFAVVAVVAGTFSLAEASWKFVVVVLGGIGVGLAVGWVIRQVRRRLDDSPTEIAIALFSGYFAYLPALALGVSAVLAVVTVGVYVGWYTPELTNARTRLQGDAVWDILTFVLNALLFTLVGLQLRPIIDGISGRSFGTLVGYAAVIGGTVVGVRLLWCYTVPYLQWRVIPLIRIPERLPPLRVLTVIGWSGMRGAVTLAAALAIPLKTDAGTTFPDRNLVIFLAFSVILVTLVGQGLTLPAIVRAMHLQQDGTEEQEEALAWIKAADAAIARLEELADEDWVREDTAERLRGMYQFRRQRFIARKHADDDGGIEQRSSDYRRLRRELLDAERGALVDLRRARQIDDTVLQRVQHELDLEDERMAD
jgi:monovalent cation/hydrogen antiporter